MVNLEILVPNHAVATVREALGRLPYARFTARSSKDVRPQLVITRLQDLNTVEGRRNFEQLYAASPGRLRDVPVVCFGAGPGGLKSRIALQALARWSHHIGQEPFIASETEAIRRMVLARQQGAEKELIASAEIEDGKLVVWSCEPKRFEVSVADIQALASMPADVLAHLEVSRSGSRIHWPGPDVDVNLDTIREHADPDFCREHEAQARREALRFAGAIRILREERGLKQSDIGGLTARQVRRLEEGDTTPHIDTLKKLAAAHGVTINDYLNELAKRSVKSVRRSATARPIRGMRSR